MHEKSRSIWNGFFISTSRRKLLPPQSSHDRLEVRIEGAAYSPAYVAHGSFKVPQLIFVQLLELALPESSYPFVVVFS